MTFSGVGSKFWRTRLSGRSEKIKEVIFIANTNTNILLNTKPGVPVNIYRVLYIDIS